MMHLRSAKNGAEERRNMLAAEIWNLSRDTLEEAFNYYHGYGLHQLSANVASRNPASFPTRMNHPSVSGARGVGVPSGGMLLMDAMPWSSSL